MTRLNTHFGGFKAGGPVVHKPADLEGLQEQVVAEYDPRKKPWYPKVKDQSQLGSCTANAANFNFEADHGQDKGGRFAPLSRLFTYYGEREIEGSLGQGDTGAFGSDAFTVAATKGICAESEMPYDITKFQVAPTAKQLSDARHHYLLHKQTRLVPQTEAAIKQVLSNGQMISFGFTVYSSFESNWEMRYGDDPNEMPVPQPGEQVLGGHEINQVGFLEKFPGFILCVNSWGPSWQKDGHFLFPIKLLTNTRMCSDFRTIVRPL